MNLFNACPFTNGSTPPQIKTGENNECSLVLTLSTRNPSFLIESTLLRECYKIISRCAHSSTTTLHFYCYLSHPPALLSPFFTLTSTSTLKLQVTVACLALLLVVSETVVTTSEAAGCNIYQMVPCMASSKDARVAPSKQCCTNIANMGKGLAGAKCLCSLLNHQLAKSNGVVPRIALGIPQKCRIAVPKGFVCQGIRVPGS